MYAVYTYFLLLVPFMCVFFSVLAGCHLIYVFLVVFIEFLYMFVANKVLCLSVYAVFCHFSERDTYVHVRYMLSAVRLSSVCCLSSVCNVGAPYSGAVCASKIQLLSKKVCYKVSLYENVQRQSCSYIIPYPTVHRSIAGDVPISVGGFKRKRA